MRDVDVGALVLWICGSRVRGLFLFGVVVEWLFSERQMHASVEVCVWMFLVESWFRSAL